MTALSEFRFSNGHYIDALEYTKNILKISSSIDEIIVNANETNETYDHEENKEQN